ncbi:isocitrate lyase/PEP mutase family protein [Actinokineospora iranica]|uniref:2-Methylisocitrate lyase, PEP mutase family n=1 Tax=Actinokineospora iranica TaxID=1271860 RepID=A0A1G6QFJ5_9PSEU|nr:isocitrate lyase/phosphoenolpyruvate mutase family protein [Actinokineospora iranica]SDC90457.1 2-Methylisocitrate lyase, PEP mutase family [Actinokineospora iranica]
MRATDQRQRAETFAALHQGPGAFVVANAWDAGTARVLTGLGFPALATTSGGLAFSLGRQDGANLVTRDETLANARDIIAATHLPVTADLENGFGDKPDDVAETIRLAAAAGLVGGSIEDATGRPDEPIYDFDLAVERVAAAAEAAKALPFTFTARAENFLHGRPDLDDTIRRLRAYADAGADVLYAPGLPTIDAIRAVCESVDRPVNVLAAGVAAKYPISKLAALGARRISLGSALPRAAITAALLAAQEIAESGTFTLAAGAMSYAKVNELMAGPDDR